MNLSPNDPRTAMAAELGYTSAALETLGTCPLWDARMINYLSLMTLGSADAAFGTLAQIERKLDETRRDTEIKYGKAWRMTQDGAELSAALHEADLAAGDAHSATYIEPYERTAIDLACTPAPTLRAAIFKTRLIRWVELDNHISMPRDPMEIVAEDFARLAAMADDPASRYHRTLDSFNAGQMAEAEYVAALDALHEWAPATPTDLLRKFLAVFSDGATPIQSIIAQLMEQAGRVFGPPTAQPCPA